MLVDVKKIIKDQEFFYVFCDLQVIAIIKFFTIIVEFENFFRYDFWDHWNDVNGE